MHLQLCPIAASSWHFHHFLIMKICLKTLKSTFCNFFCIYKDIANWFIHYYCLCLSRHRFMDILTNFMHLRMKKNSSIHQKKKWVWRIKKWIMKTWSSPKIETWSPSKWSAESISDFTWNLYVLDEINSTILLKKIFNLAVAIAWHFFSRQALCNFYGLIFFTKPCSLKNLKT